MTTMTTPKAVSREITPQDIEKFRQTILQVSKDQLITADDAQNSRNTLSTICSEASRFGFTTADVIRSICTPVLQKKPSTCGCPTCRYREEQQIEQDQNTT